MSSGFNSLECLPPDPLLGLMALANADPRTGKIDVSVGVYRNQSGVTPVMEAVRTAEQRIARSQTTKAYEGSRGNTAFCETIERLCLGTALREQRAHALASYATPGGCGALWAGMSVAKRARPGAMVWISRPGWVNYRHIARSAGFEVCEYRYLDPHTQSLDFDGAVESLEQAGTGDLVILQGPCHNPTGLDLSADQWAQLSEIFIKRGLIAFIDIAYHGFGASLEEDLAGTRHFMSRQPFFLLSYSCSKNFGLYRERTGCLIAASENASARDRLSSHIASVTRAGYSMPPAHGAAIVRLIADTSELHDVWVAELKDMREQIASARLDLQRALSEATGADFGFLSRQNGMFSLLPLPEEACERLREKHAIYIPGNGRINFAALNSATMRPFVTAIAPFLRHSSKR